MFFYDGKAFHIQTRYLPLLVFDAFLGVFGWKFRQINNINVKYKIHLKKDKKYDCDVTGQNLHFFMCRTVKQSMERNQFKNESITA